MSTAVAERPKADFRQQWEAMSGGVAAALPPHIPVERFMRVVLTAVNGNADLMGADRTSLFEASMKAAQDGLLPDGRDGALVIFNTKVKDGGREVWIKKVQWMPMIGGILKKIRNSGELKTISAHVAYENDAFTYILGDEEKIEHAPAIGDRGKPRLVYAIAHTKDGGIYREVMTIQDVEKVRAVSKTGASGPWKDWWEEMARKTVLRRLAKRLPMSSDLDDLIRQDDSLYEFGEKEPKQVASGLAARLSAPAERVGFSTDTIQRETAALGEQFDRETGEVTQAQKDEPFPGDPPAEAAPASQGQPAAQDDAFYALSQKGEILKDGDGNLEQALKRARKGMAALERWMSSLASADEKRLGSVLPQLRKIADRADVGEA